MVPFVTIKQPIHRGKLKPIKPPNHLTIKPLIHKKKANSGINKTTCLRSESKNKHSTI